jgi:integrase
VELNLKSENSGGLTFSQSKSFQENLIWEKLDFLNVESAITDWLGTLSENTQINYRSGIQKLVERGVLDPFSSLQSFALINHETIIDRIKSVEYWSEATRQARAACYISFTTFLQRRFKGIIKKALPSREDSSKTFYKIREKVKTRSMTQSQWIEFFKKLEKINSRDCLIGKIILQGGKRVNEALSLDTGQIDWESREIRFKQSKSKKAEKETIITYSAEIMADLKAYVGDRQGHVFVTRTGSPVLLNQLAQTFCKAGLLAGIPFKVTPHVLRASTVTFLKGQGFQDIDIMKITGHASAEMVFAYDKSAMADNASKKVNLI